MTNYKWTPAYQTGQKVWLSSQDIPLKTPRKSKELMPPYIGSFEIMSIINPPKVKIKLSRSMLNHPLIHKRIPDLLTLCSLLKPLPRSCNWWSLDSQCPVATAYATIRLVLPKPNWLGGIWSWGTQLGHPHVSHKSLLVFLFVCISIMGMALLSPDIHQLINPISIYPGLSSTHCHIVASASVIDQLCGSFKPHNCAF